MASRPLLQSAFEMLLVLGFLVGLACTDDPTGSGDPCEDAPQTIFIASKLDDDDGDGNPRDENFPHVNDEDDDIADHTWIRDDRGVHHLFFQNEGHAAGSSLEHYKTADFVQFEYVGANFHPNPSGWDSYALWAPHVVRSGGIYYMFYTGTTGPGSDPRGVQRIGLATSTDLVHWARVPSTVAGIEGDGCIYDCSEPWTTWGREDGSYDHQCRDPFVLWDEAKRRWVLFATAKSTNGHGVVTVAYSTNLRNWQGAGFIDATRRLADGVGAQRTGGQAENPAVIPHQGRFTLLFSDWRDPEDACGTLAPRTIVQYVTSTRLDADPQGSAHWTYRGPIPDPGVNAIEAQWIGSERWILTQSVSNPNCCDHTQHRRELRMREIVWGPDGSFSTVLPKPFGCEPARE